MFTIYHNPRCSKSRETLALLEASGTTPRVVEYLKTPPTPAELKSMLAALKLSPRDILRNKEPEYKALNLGDSSLDDNALIEAICQHPKLLERPIVVSKNGAVVGRPPENVQALLQAQK